MTILIQKEYFYGSSERPDTTDYRHLMMLAANKEIKSKDDVIQVARTYFSCWEIEE